MQDFPQEARDVTRPGLLPDCCPKSSLVAYADNGPIRSCRDNADTGATGLEPATSGVTGHFEGRDGWRPLRRNRSSHAAFSAFPRFDSASLSEHDFRRLLPVCCPPRLPQVAHRRSICELNPSSADRTNAPSRVSTSLGTRSRRGRLSAEVRTAGDPLRRLPHLICSSEQPNDRRY